MATGKSRFSHAYDFSFEIESEDFYAKDVTPDMLRAALMARAQTLTDDDLKQACGLFDTMQINGD